MAAEFQAEIPRFVERKSFTTESKRRICKKDGGVATETRRTDYAMELGIACTPIEGDPENTQQIPPAKAQFQALVDTGYNGHAMISQLHYEHLCSFGTGTFEGLPYQPVTLAGGGRVHWRRARNCNLWLFPAGQGVATEPVRVPVRVGIVVSPVVERKSSGDPEGPEDTHERRCYGAVIGMAALRDIKAHVEIDYVRQEFSVRVPD